MLIRPHTLENYTLGPNKRVSAIVDGQTISRGKYLQNMIYTLYTHNTSIVLMFINQFRAPTANKIKSNTGTTIQIDNITCYLACREILVPFYFCPSCPHHQRTRQFLNIFVNIYQIYFILRQMSKLKTRQKSMNGVKGQKKKTYGQI